MPVKTLLRCHHGNRFPGRLSDKNQDQTKDQRPQIPPDRARRPQTPMLL